VTDPIRVESLTKEYGPVTALDAVDVTVRPGTLHGLLGPNGSGKTTLLNVCLGLTNPTAGRVERPTASFGCSFQTPTVYRDMTVAENLRVFARMDGGIDEAWHHRLREDLALSTVAHRRAGALSDGWQKRLDLALSVLRRPAFAVLDEPLDDLDDVTRNRFRDLLVEYTADDHAVLVATHNPRHFEATFDRLTILHRGTVLYDGEPPTDQSSQELYRELVGA
jgi:ABC-2 type transport system ATP-binding protein